MGFGQLQWKDSFTINETDFERNFFIDTDVPFTAADSPSLMVTSTETDLHSAELMYRQQMSPCLYWTGGLRYIAINDEVGIFFRDDLVGGGATGRYTLGVDNDLIGAQFGFGGDFCVTDRFSIALSAKLGLLANLTELRVSYFEEFLTPNQTEEGKAENSNFAVSGEVGVEGFWKVGENVGLFGGYQLLVVDGVAGGLSNIDRTYTDGLGNAIQDEDSPVYHGGNLGIRIRFP